MCRNNRKIFELKILDRLNNIYKVNRTIKIIIRDIAKKWKNS